MTSAVQRPAKSLQPEPPRVRGRRRAATSPRLFLAWQLLRRVGVSASTRPSFPLHSGGRASTSCTAALQEPKTATCSPANPGGPTKKESQP